MVIGVKYYQVKHASDCNLSIDDKRWSAIEDLWIDCFPWHQTNAELLPETSVRLLHSEDEISVCFDVKECNPVATYTKPNDPVCRDSCVEFFFTPNLEDLHYLSFEINPLGTLLIGFGTSGNDIRYLNTDRELFKIETNMEQDCWQVKYQIPFFFLREYFQKVDVHWKGNFMKCADRSATPHHGCWNLIGTAIPMFHMPEYFGRIDLCENKT